jgi:Domain of unknown function (DUF4342)
MSEHTWWETIEAKGGAAIDHVRRLIAEGNVRRVRVRQKDEIVAEFPLTVGVVGAVLAPPLAALGAVVALIADCRIEIERTGEPASKPSAAPADTPAD